MVMKMDLKMSRMEEMRELRESMMLDMFVWLLWGFEALKVWVCV